MELRITLAPNGGLRLILPTGRALDVGATASSLTYIQRILTDVAKGSRDQRGYIAEYPTQHVIEIWKREDERKKLDAEKQRYKDRGIDIDKLEFRL